MRARPSKMKGNFHTWDAVMAAALLAVVGLEVLAYSAPIEERLQTLSVRVNGVKASGPVTQLSLAVTHGRGDRALQLAAFPISLKSIVYRAVFVFNDSAYPTANTTPTAGQGILDNLAGELRSRGYQNNISGISADGLRFLFEDTASASQFVVVIPTGVLPDDVFSSRLDLVTKWVSAGGVLVWGGGVIGFWSGTRGKPLAATNIVGAKGAEQLLGKGLVHFPTASGRLGDTPSDFAVALGLTYKLTSSGILRSASLARGGLALGWYLGPYSSVTYLPSGSGGFLLFGGEILDEVAVAKDMARLLLAVPMYAMGPVATMSLDLRALPDSATVSWNIPIQSSDADLLVAAYDPDPEAIYFQTTVVPTSPGG